MLTAVVLLIAWVEVSAQVYDTIHRRSPNYYYTEWCDEDSVFYVPYPPYRPGTTFTIRMCFYDVAGVGNLYQGIDHYTPRPLEVKGLSCMVAQQYITGCHTDRYFYERDTGNFPEHMYIYQRDSVTDSLVMLDSVRWDTAAPKILELPRNYDTSSGSEYCYVYEAMLDKPVTVNGRFFIASSNRNWTCRDVSPFPIYKPFIQVSIAYENRPTPQYHTLYRNYDTAHGQFDNNFLNDNRWYHYGPYFAIVEKTMFSPTTTTLTTLSGRVRCPVSRNWQQVWVLKTVVIWQRYKHFATMLFAKPVASIIYLPTGPTTSVSSVSCSVSVTIR